MLITILKKIDNYFLVSSDLGDTEIINIESLKDLIEKGRVSNPKEFF